MDDDCIVKTNTLEELVKFALEKNDNFGFLSSKVLWTDSKICKMNLQRKTVFKTLKNVNENSEIAMASFVSLFLKTKIVKQYGLPIKEFFIWTDDWEYTRRISKNNKSYFVASSVVIHKSKNNFGANIVKEGEDRLERYNYIYRNDTYLYKREGIKGFLYLFARNFYNIVNILLFSKNKFKRMSIILKSTHKGFKFHPKIEYVEKNDEWR